MPKSRVHPSRTSGSAHSSASLDVRLLCRFAELAQLFFPRIPQLRSWRIRVMRPGRESEVRQGGYTDLERREILIHRRYLAPGSDALDLDQVLVHELTHATGRTGHSAWFCKRLTMAGRRARRLGMPELAGRIEAEVVELEAHDRAAVEEVYDRITNIVEHSARCTWRQVLATVATEIGLYPAEFLAQYRRARAVFDRAVLEQRMIRRLQDRLESGDDGT